MSARASRGGRERAAVSQPGITRQGLGPPPSAPARNAAQSGSAVNAPNFQAWQAREARAHELHARDGLQEHLDKLEVERQSLKEWTKTLPLDEPENDEDSPTGYVSDVARSPQRARGSAGKAKQVQTYAERKKEVEVLDKLTSNALPRELVLLILEYMVDSRAADFELQDQHTLLYTSMKLLGISAPARKLSRLAQKILLQRSRIQLDIPFTRHTGGGDPIAQVPPLVLSLPHPISHLALACDVGIHSTRLTYPISIFRMTRGAGSLKQAFPDLDRFTLLLNLKVDDNVWQSPEAALNTSCFCGYTATTTHRELVLKMLAAVYVSGPGRRKMLKLSFCRVDSEKRDEGAPVIIQPSRDTVKYDVGGEDVAVHPMRQVLLQAIENEANKIEASNFEPVIRRSRGTAGSVPPPSYPAPTAAYSQWSNDDMVMLEDETRTVGYPGDSESSGQRQLRVADP